MHWIGISYIPSVPYQVIQALDWDKLHTICTLSSYSNTGHFGTSQSRHLQVGTLQTQHLANSAHCTLGTYSAPRMSAPYKLGTGLFLTNKLGTKRKINITSKSYVITNNVTCVFYTIKNGLVVLIVAL